ncbi:MAG: diguanylate cyclase [Gemmatimonadota bacterium]
MNLSFSVNDNCTACMACVRVCPVEAIAVSGNEVRIVGETCIECGLCVPACHHDAIDVVGDIREVREAIEKDRAILILPAEVAVSFHPATPEQIINACFRAGFHGVYFETLGDELVAHEYLRLWREDSPRTWIRSTSSIVVDYCRVRLPALLPFLAPIVTPAVALGRFLRTHYGPEYRIIYAGLATPGPDRDEQGISACISFEELKDLLIHKGADPERQPLTLERIPPERRRHLSTAGGLPLAMLEEESLSSRRFSKIRGLHALSAVAQAVVSSERELGFLDVLPFEGSLDHPAFGRHEDLFWRKAIAELAEGGRSGEPVVDVPPALDLSASFEPNAAALPPADSAQAARVLERIGRAPGGAYWDCGACGHARCVDFADAISRGRATLSICPYYLGRQVEQASRDAMHDALTGLFTYRVLEERLAQEVARANRSGTSLAVLFIDLDDFKPINDRLGHAAGNDILRGVADILRGAIRATDIACRFGGDEFVLILVNADPEGAARVAEEIRSQAETFRVHTPQGEAGVTLSIGLAYHSGAARSVLTSEALMAEADASLYVAKAHGGNTVHPAIGGKLVR